MRGVIVLAALLLGCGGGHVVTSERRVPPSDAEVLVSFVAATTCASPAPVELDGAVVAAHCRQLTAALARHRERWLEPVRAHFAGLPAVARVFYPFAGADPMTVLAVYPAATDIVTVSLEPLKLPTDLGALSRARLYQALGRLRRAAGALLDASYSATRDLAGLTADLPLLGVAFVGLAAVGATPVALRSFDLATDGSVVHPGPHLEVELRLSSGATATWRHLVLDLSDHGLPPALTAHLARAPYAALVKAGAYLLWRRAFSRTLALVLAARLIVADSSGPRPADARAAGFTLHPAGHFVTAALPTPDAGAERDLGALFSDAPALGFRFGYASTGAAPDEGHVLIYQR